ncbi:hypothetical protein [Streptomyces sp. NBC_00057]|uniref:hypothetical protein n=1 Tax=Streptomyces sp. NBC_00057 TaxID=2975634 RepID=UPI00324F6C55
MDRTVFVHHLADYSLFGHTLYQQPALDGRLHWARFVLVNGLVAGGVEGVQGCGAVCRGRPAHV